MKIGIISDTHNLIRPEVYIAFEGVELILHAGDIGERDILIELEAIAPVRAVLGNNDHNLPPAIKEREEFRLKSRTVRVQHIFRDIPNDNGFAQQDAKNIQVFGHSHMPFNQRIEDTLYFNPGSAGPRRLKLPITVGIVTLLKNRIESEIISLEESKFQNTSPHHPKKSES